MLILLVVKAEVVPFVRDFVNQTHLKGTFCALYINFDILKIYNSVLIEMVIESNDGNFT